MAGSGASESLQDVWTATVLAIRDVYGSLNNGTCHLNNVAAAPLVEIALGERVTICAGFGAFDGRGGRIEFGARGGRKSGRAGSTRAEVHTSILRPMFTPGSRRNPM
jgi:hypothetical protein